MVILPILEAAFSKVVGRWWGNDSGVEFICLVLSCLTTKKNVLKRDKEIYALYLSKEI
jgi:hypothetical protein